MEGLLMVLHNYGIYLCTLLTSKDFFCTSFVILVEPDTFPLMSDFLYINFQSPLGSAGHISRSLCEGPLSSVLPKLAGWQHP